MKSDGSELEFDYDLDSDDEWEEEGEGDECLSGDDDVSAPFRSLFVPFPNPQISCGAKFPRGAVSELIHLSKVRVRRSVSRHPVV